MELCGVGGARRFPRLQLPGNSHADLRERRNCSRAAWAKRPTLFRKRCTHGRIRAARRAIKDNRSLFAPKHSRSRSRVHRAQTLGSRAEQALLHRPAVPPRTSAERPLSPVLSNRRRSHRPADGGQRVSGARCGSSGDAGDAARPAGDHRWNLELNSVGCPNDRAAYQRSAA